jgi:hypothetical protein
VYDSPVTQSGWSKLKLGLVGPQFDLPLENITWQIFVPEAWEIKNWKSSLQLLPGDPNITSELISLQSYLESEVAEGQEKTRDAENLLQMGNNLLQKGVPQQARRAFSAAWRLSQHDVAFNEDARVQLHNLKLQQALLGLNQRKTVGGPDVDERSGKSADWLAAQPGQAPAYTQQQVQKILEQNSAEENQALMRLADRLIRQQDAAMAKPESIRATLPKQGRLLTFTGSLQVETWKALQIQLVAKVRSAVVTGSHLAILFAIFAGLAVLALAARRPAEQG